MLMKYDEFTRALAILLMKTTQAEKTLEEAYLFNDTEKRTVVLLVVLVGQYDIPISSLTGLGFSDEVVELTDLLFRKPDETKQQWKRRANKNHKAKEIINVLEKAKK